MSNKIHESHLPSMADMLIHLRNARNAAVGIEEGIDVRLQVRGDDDWSFRAGDASYDQDHRGYWGASSVSEDMEDEQLRAVATDLQAQVLDQAASDDALAD